jgi:proteasome accessory factor A
MDRSVTAGGLENEYGVTCTLRGQRRLSPDEVARYLFRKVVAGDAAATCSCRTAARLYLDVGSHPEYATPSAIRCVRPVVIHDKAGERILEGSRSAEQRLREEGIRGTVYLFKNNTDSAGNSYGCHENYLTSRRDDFGHYAEVLIPFLVSRQIYHRRRQGAADRPRARCSRSASGPSTSGRACRSATTRSRPIINTRDEPHADAERYRRLHVIVGDSNMSEYTTFLKVGATACCCACSRTRRRAARHDAGEPDPGHPRDQPRHHLHRKVRLANGREVGARHPERVPRPGAALRRDQGLNPEEKMALEPGSTAVTTIENDPLKLDREVDWVIKHNLIEAYRAATTCRSAIPRSPCSTCSTTTSAAIAAVLQAAGPGPGRAGVHDADIELATDDSRRRPPGPGSAASSSARPRSASGTTRSTGCT